MRKEEMLEYADVYFLNDDEFCEIYYNPDADAGGQMVYNRISLDLMQRASVVAETENDFFTILDSECTQYLFDKGTAEFDNLLDELTERAEVIESGTVDLSVGVNRRWIGTIEKLRDYAMSQLLIEDIEL